MNGVDFQKLVASSRSIRRFATDESVTDDDLYALINAARLAPSGNNSQLIRYRVVVEEEEAKRVLAHTHWAALFKDWDGPTPQEMPHGFIALCLPEDQTSNPVRLMDVGIAAQTICLAAAARHLGACMIKSFDKHVQEEFSLDGYNVVLLVAFGYPAEQVVIDEAEDTSKTAYYRDEKDVHHVPKLALEDILL